MEVKKAEQEKILKSISEIGQGATITEIGKKVNLERHTLSKYLSFMRGHGLVSYRHYGKAKVWTINKAPLQTALNSLPEHKTFTEKMLSDLVNTLPLGLLIMDEEYTIFFMNKTLEKEYGCQNGEKFFATFLGLENPVSLKAMNKLIWGQAKETEFEIKDKQGKTLQVTAVKLINPDSSFSYLLLLHDTTEKVNAEIRTREHEAMLEAERDALQKSAIVSETDTKGFITYVNEKFVKISKYGSKELIGKTHKIINSGYHPKSFFRNMWKTIQSGKVWRGIIKNKAKDGSFYWVDSAIAPVLGSDGKPVKYISIRFDITRLKELERLKAMHPGVSKHEAESK